MPATKIQDAKEIERWLEEGRSYPWMVEQYLIKYNLVVRPTMFGNFRTRRGIEPRVPRYPELLPWEVKEEHRYRSPAQLLRLEGRRRAGTELTQGEKVRLERWLKRLEDSALVVHYDPDTDEGWFYIPREDSDNDIIRHPRDVRRSRL